MQRYTPSALLILIFSLVVFPPLSNANIFEQFFGGGGGPSSQQQPRQQGNAPSTSDNYRQQYFSTPCDKYLCPDTLACVHFPHHCPCAFPDIEDKVELGEGVAICASKGGFKEGEMERKVELVRKGLLWLIRNSTMFCNTLNPKWKDLWSRLIRFSTMLISLRVIQEKQQSIKVFVLQDWPYLELSFYGTWRLMTGRRSPYNPMYMSLGTTAGKSEGTW